MYVCTRTCARCVRLREPPHCVARVHAQPLRVSIPRVGTHWNKPCTRTRGSNRWMYGVTEARFESTSSTPANYPHLDTVRERVKRFAVAFEHHCLAMFSDPRSDWLEIPRTEKRIRRTKPRLERQLLDHLFPASVLVRVVVCSYNKGHPAVRPTD